MDIFSEQINLQSLEEATRLLKESRQGFLKLFNNSPVCMSMTTPQRVYRKVNKKFLEKFGYTEEEVIGHTSIEVGILDKEESLKVGNIIKEKGRLQNDYVKCIAKDGTIVHTISSIELMELNGETHLISFFIDISKIVEQQEIIEQHVQQLEEVNKELEAFSYSVSHDLMAPLRAISRYVQILEEDFYEVFDEDGKKALTAVQRNAKKMATLIEDLLSFARVGKKAVMKTGVDMNDLVKEILMDLNASNPYKAKILIGNLHPAQADQALIKQVMVNLISNAIKYSSKKENPEIEITSEANDKEIIYTIKDNGEGFDMKYIDKLFGVFQRLHAASDFEGTGVGLATVQRIINKHGGVIKAEAEVGKGATFTFTLPV